MGVPELVALAAFLCVLGALALVQRQVRLGQLRLALRQHTSFAALRRHVGLALESGHPPLLTLGRGPLHTAAGPTSVAGLHFLQHVAETSGRGQLTPQVTMGAATLLPVAQDVLRSAAEENQDGQFDRAKAQFIADDSFPLTYAAGTADIIERGNLTSSIAVGRFGSELAIIGEAAARNKLEQVIGSDDPSAIAIAIATTENSLWGEEIFAASAYLRESEWNLAAVRIQDLLRWLVVVALLGATALHILGLI